METEKRNFIGDFVMSSVLGCAAFVSLFVLSLMVLGIVVIILSIVNF